MATMLVTVVSAAVLCRLRIVFVAATGVATQQDQHSAALPCNGRPDDGESFLRSWPMLDQARKGKEPSR
jgi:hypothetical protein